RRSVEPAGMPKRLDQLAAAGAASFAAGRAAATFIPVLENPERSSKAAATPLHPRGGSAGSPCGERSARTTGAEGESAATGRVSAHPRSATSACPSAAACPELWGVRRRSKTAVAPPPLATPRRATLV